MAVQWQDGAGGRTAPDSARVGSKGVSSPQQGKNMPTLSSPEDFLHYYEVHERHDPNDRHWHDGAEMCRWWSRLIAEVATQQDVDDFLARLKSEENAGSAWFDLRLRFGEWAKSQGFLPEVTPTRHPRKDW